MKMLLRFVFVALAGFPVGLTGCGRDLHPPAYSSAVKFGLREDPILKASANQIGDERFDPDPPGILPIMKLEEVSLPENPFYPKSKEIREREMMRDPRKVLARDRKALEEALEAIFGVPGQPAIDAKAAEISEESISGLKLDAKTLAEGSAHYRIHCMHCHGVPGDGRGPTGRWINPHPRDFRAGKFKFQSVNQLETLRPPAREDLLRTLRNGIEGTAMPTFRLLHDEELEALVSYVIFLSVRGNTEINTLIGDNFDWNKDKNALEWDQAAGPMVESVKTSAKSIVDRWVGSQSPEMAIKVAPYPYKQDDLEGLKASVQRGQQLFTAKPSPEFLKEYRGRLFDEEFNKLKAGKADATEIAKIRADLEASSGKRFTEQAESKLKAANCVSCHVDFGRQAKFRPDDWATLVRPNNFTQGVFRGGRRPVDMYYRIHSGITGSGMTPFGATLQGQDIWDLVNFVSSLSYPTMRRELGVNID